MGSRGPKCSQEQAVHPDATRRRNAHCQGRVPRKPTRATRGFAVRNATSCCENVRMRTDRLTAPVVVDMAGSCSSFRLRPFPVSATVSWRRLMRGTTTYRGSDGYLTRLSVSPRPVAHRRHPSNGRLQSFARSTPTSQRGNGMSTTAKGPTSSSGTRMARRSSSATPCPARSSPRSTPPCREAPTSALRAG